MELVSALAIGNASESGEASRRRGGRPRLGPIRLSPPEVVPMTAEQEEAAIQTGPFRTSPEECRCGGTEEEVVFKTVAFVRSATLPPAWYADRSSRSTPAPFPTTCRAAEAMSASSPILRKDDRR
jgi:hypothetical protein